MKKCPPVRGCCPSDNEEETVKEQPMSHNLDSKQRAPRREFLVDTPDYQGISRQFEPLQGLVTKQLRRDETLQQQWLCESAISQSIEELFAAHEKLEFVIAGWVDQAVLEYHSIEQGNRSCLARVLDELDAYRPAENGDLCFYVTDLEYDQVLVTTFSFEDQAISSTRYQQKR